PLIRSPYRVGHDREVVDLLREAGGDEDARLPGTVALDRDVVVAERDAVARTCRDTDGDAGTTWACCDEEVAVDGDVAGGGRLDPSSPCRDADVVGHERPRNPPLGSPSELDHGLDVVFGHEEVAGDDDQVSAPRHVERDPGRTRLGYDDDVAAQVELVDVG